MIFKGVVDRDFTFLTLVSVMLLFEHKQYLQSYDAESSMQTEISSLLKLWQFNAYKKWLVETTAGYFPGL